MNLEKILIKHAPSNRPCGIRNIETIEEIKNESGLNISALAEALNELPGVKTIGGSNEIACIEIGKEFPTK
ncbi:hypothetical protein [Ligilactobacillus cholophilus]|uniref:hypothetical protein n=1 Tax=Ligilactobacillus cholophilus TaxID=3050131 RepID=UPI0025B12814|nr:hypothetical protein [Ligilactobacillus cholophilus]